MRICVYVLSCVCVFDLDVLWYVIYTLSRSFTPPLSLFAARHLLENTNDERPS